MPKRKVDTRVASAALLFAALGDPTRLTLLQQLSHDGPASISALAEQRSMTRQGVTKHLRALAGAGIIDGNRQGASGSGASTRRGSRTAAATSRSSRRGGTTRWARFKLLVEE